MLATTLPQAPHIAVTSSLSKTRVSSYWLSARHAVVCYNFTVFEVYCNDWLFALYWDGMKAQHCHVSFLITISNMFTLGVCPKRNSFICALKKRITYAFCFVAKKSQSKNNYIFNALNDRVSETCDPQSFKFMFKSRIVKKRPTLI